MILGAQPLPTATTQLAVGISFLAVCVSIGVTVAAQLLPAIPMQAEAGNVG